MNKVRKSFTGELYENLIHMVALSQKQLFNLLAGNSETIWINEVNTKRKTKGKIIKQSHFIKIKLEED